MNLIAIRPKLFFSYCVIVAVLAVLLASNARATVTVTGDVTPETDSSYWTSDTDITIGGKGTGTLSITEGEFLLTKIGYIGGVYKDGTTADSYGEVWVDGEETEWEAYYIHMGNGSLSITNGATVESGSISIGYWADSNGTLTIDGTDSSLTGCNNVQVGYYGSGTLNVVNGGSLEGSGQIGPNGITSSAVIDGEGSSWHTGSSSISVGYALGDGSTLSVSDGASVSTSRLTVNEGSTLTIDALSSVKVGEEDTDWSGRIDNDGTIQVVAGAGVDAGTYWPLSYGSISIFANFLALGGVWDAFEQTITVSEAVTARGSGGGSAVLDLLTSQRAVITDSDTGMSAGGAFMAAETSSEITFTATAAGDADTASLLSLLTGGDETLLSAWAFSIDGYETGSDSPVYLSLFADLGGDLLDLTIWYLADGTWEEYDATDLAWDGTYASFTVTELGSYAVSTSAPVPVPGAGLLLLSGLVALAGIRGRKS